MKFEIGDKIHLEGKVYNVQDVIDNSQVQGPRYLLNNRGHLWSITENYILENRGKKLNKINPPKI